MTNNLLKSFKKYDKDKPKVVKEISGILGIPIGGRKTVEVPNRNGFVYVRLRNNDSELIQAFNEKVSPVYGLPVLVHWSVNRYEVIGRDKHRYSDWGSYSSFLPRHGSQHSLNFDDGQGGDVSFIYSRQFMPFATIPSGTIGAGTVFVMPHVYRNPVDASWSYIGDESSPNFLPAKPTGTSARMMLLVWDLTTSDPLIVTGTFFSSSLTGTSAILPYVPTVTNQSYVPLAAIRLVSGTQSLLWDNIYDMRQYAVTTPSAFAGGFSIWDEGIPKGTGTTLNFVGSGVDVSVSGSVARIHISGSAGEGTIFAQDEGIALGTPTTFNFVGDNVSASISGSVVRVFVTGSAGGSINTGTLDARYLKLSADNDPLTGLLEIIPSTDTNALNTRVNGFSTAIYGEQYPFSGSTSPNTVMTLLRRYNSTGVIFNSSLIQGVTYNSGTTTGGFVDYVINDNTRIKFNPSINSTGTAHFLDTETTMINGGKLFSLLNFGTEKFYVKHDGGMVSNGTPLWTTVVKTADVSVQSDTTLSQDSDLLFSMVASTKYVIRGKIWYTTPAAADFKFRFRSGGTPTVFWVKYMYQVPLATSLTQAAIDIVSPSTTVSALSAGAVTDPGYIEFEARVEKEAATNFFFFDWAQVTSTASDTSVKAGSYIEYRAI